MFYMYMLNYCPINYLPKIRCLYMLSQMIFYMEASTYAVTIKMIILSCGWIQYFYTIIMFKTLKLFCNIQVISVNYEIQFFKSSIVENKQKDKWLQHIYLFICIDTINWGLKVPGPY